MNTPSKAAARNTIPSSPIRAVSHLTDNPAAIAPAVPPAAISPNSRFAPRKGNSSAITTQNPEVNRSVPMAVQR